MLPHEWQLIQTLDCSYEEYQDYKRKLINYGTRRPSAYAAIPDVQNGVVSIVVSLVVGLALSAVSALLAPKPTTQPKKKENRQKKLADDTSQTNFGATQGFDSSQSLAKLGSPVPLFFGKFEEGINGKPATGGLSIAPQLVWSRMFSYGNHQGFKGLYVVGEVMDSGDTQQGPPPPLAGIQVGTTPLSTLPPDQYAVYWSSAHPYNRIKKRHLTYGTEGYPAAGDPTPHDDVFNCPTRNRSAGEGFCMTSAPTGDASFGVSAPISNGTGWRLNFRIIPLPNKEFGKDDPGFRIRAERSLIVGRQNAGGEDGMRGAGAGWSPLMGIYSHNGSVPSVPLYDVKVKVGDEIVFKIRGIAASKSNFGAAMFIGEAKDVSGDDIRNRSKSMRESADIALQVGSLFTIGRTVWQVMRRTGGYNGAWNEGKNDVDVTLKCVELTTNADAALIGVAGRGALAYGDAKRFQTYNGYGPASKEEGWVGTGFWPLLSTSFAIVKNTRPVDTTEIGIKSQVWNQANGLCNFASLVSPSVLEEYEAEGNTIDNGVLTRYFKRSSLFTLDLRPVGSDSKGEPFPWTYLGETFVVTGEKPVDQFNYIRLKSNNGPVQFEYRFVPRAWSDIRATVNPDKEFWRLKAGTGQEIGKTINTAYGALRLTITGEKVRNGDLRLNQELIKGRGEDRTVTTTKREAISMEKDAWLPLGSYAGRAAAYHYELFGHPDSNRYATKTVTRVFTGSGGRTVTARYTARCIRSPFPDYTQNFGAQWYWDAQPIVITKSDNFARDITDTFVDDTVSTSSSNPFTRDPSTGFTNFNKCGMRALLTEFGNVTTTEIIPGDPARSFETASQLSELSHYAEISKSCDSSPEHTITYINESIKTSDKDDEINDGPTYPYTMLGLSFRSSSFLQNINQVRVWLSEGMNAKHNDPRDTTKRGPTSNFADVANYILSNEVGGLGSYGSASALIDYESLARTARFMAANKLRFDGAIGDRVNARSYLAEIAPYFLCNFLIGNGMFSMEPAVPYDEATGEIKPSSIQVSNYFNERSIVEGSYKLSYLDADQRQDFAATLSYREGARCSLPAEKTVVVRWNEPQSTLYPQEEIDLSDFCTSEEHAIKVGRFVLSLRRRIDHTVQFETIPTELGLRPGAFIVIQTTVSPVASQVNAAVDPSNGQILSTKELSDGSHTVSIYVPGSEDVETMSIDVKNGAVVDPKLYGSVFSLLVPREEENLYQIEQVELSPEGLAMITASHHPATKMGSEWRSTLAEDVLDINDDIFITES